MKSERCPGCGVVCAHLDVEHLNDCRYQGRNALEFPQIAAKRLDAFRGTEKEGFEPSFAALRQPQRPLSHNAGSGTNGGERP